MLSTLLKVAVVIGLLWAGNQLKLDAVSFGLRVMACVLAFQWFALPYLETWFKDLVKQAMREKHWEDLEGGLSDDDAE